MQQSIMGMTLIIEDASFGRGKPVPTSQPLHWLFPLPGRPSRHLPGEVPITLASKGLP